MDLKPTILSFQRLRQDADRNLMPDLAAVYAESLGRLMSEHTSWDVYLAAFKVAIPKRDGGIDA